MTRLSGYQPQYFPRLHYFARFLDSDIFAISDYLQYVRKHAYPTKDGKTVRGVSYQAHTPIKTAQGILLLDIPVRKGGIEGRQLMTDALIDYTSTWQQKNLNSIQHHYHKAPQFNAVFPNLSVVLMQRYETLASCTIASTLWALSVLFEMPCYRPKGPTIENVQDHLPVEPFRLKRIIRMSSSDIPAPNKAAGRDANDWIIDKCKKLGADEYYFGGTAASAYMDDERIRNAGITLTEQHWVCQPYPQLYGPFTPNLSIIDLLMNTSPAEARRILSTPKS